VLSGGAFKQCASITNLGFFFRHDTLLKRHVLEYETMFRFGRERERER